MSAVARALALLLLSVCSVIASLAIAAPQRQPQPQIARPVYLPLIAHFEAIPFGVETSRGWLAKTEVRASAQQLGIKWVRLNAIRWRPIQPTQGAPYDVSRLASFDADLQAALALGLTPVVIVNDSPSWATINRPTATSCGAIRADRFADFAAFMGWLATRYKGRIQYWEIGNEPDVDPTLVPTNQVFGCWGDIADPYYGGEHYGRMLKVVAPAIKRANPWAQVVVGGLALMDANTTEPGLGKPERFFEGILRAGAGDSFDAVGYHSYPGYTNQPLDYDYDREPNSSWASMGGYTLGKAKFLRALMAKYGVSKPLMLNETGLTCPTPPNGICGGVGPTFYQAQSAYAIRMITRAWSTRVQQIMWYTLHGPGWFDSGLLDENQQPRPVYRAYQNLITMTSRSDPPVPIHDYDRDDVRVEAYRFNKGMTLVDVVWAKDLSTYYVEAPPKFTKAYDQYGAEIDPIGPYIPVNFSAVYIEHQR
jgi:Cellulase (glycosyl hydrolase family 5)